MRLTAWDPEAASWFADVDADGPVVAPAATGFTFTEGPVWCPRLAGGAGLLFSDIPEDTIFRWRPGAARAEVWRRPSGQSNGLTLDREGRLLVCEHERRRVSRSRIEGPALYGSEPVVLAERCGGGRLNSPNDIIARSDGTIFFTDPTYGLRDAYGERAAEHEEQPARAVYRIRPGQAAAVPALPSRPQPAPPEPEVAAVGFTQPNGLALSGDEATLYVGDSAEGNLRAFRVAADGTLSDGRVVHAFDRSAGRGNPDGMRLDAAGRLWSTGPGGLWVLAGDGRPLAHLRFPEVTANLAWAEDGRTLCVTATTTLYRVRTTVGGAAGRP